MKKTALLIAALLAGAAAFAETIKDIRIVNQAGESYDISSVSAFTSFRIGEQVSDQNAILSAIAIDVNRMKESGRYSYVNARMDVAPDGVVLVYTVASLLQKIESAFGAIRAGSPSWTRSSPRRSNDRPRASTRSRPRS